MKEVNSTEIKEDSLKKQASYNLIGRVISFIISTATPIILVRLFLQEEYGIFKEIIIISQIVSGIISFNISNSLYYFYPRVKKQNNQSFLMSQTIFVMLFLSIVFLISTVFLDKTFYSYYNFEIYGRYYLPLILLIFFTITSDPLDKLFIVEKKSLYALIYYISSQLLRLGLILITILVFKTVYSTVLSLILLALLKTIFLYVYLFINYGLSIFKIDLKMVTHQFKYVFPMGLSLIAGIFGQHAEKLVLMANFSASDFALYSVGTFGVPLGVLYLSIGNVILPKLSEYSINNELNSTLLLWKKMIKVNAIITIPVVVFFLISAKQFVISLFGIEYELSVLVFRIIILSLFFQMLGHGYVLRAYAITKFILFSRIIKMLTSIVMSYFLVVNYGIIGAAVTFLTAFIVNVLLQVYKTKKLLKTNLTELLPWKDFINLLLISTVPAIFLFVINNLPISIFLQLLYGAFVYFISVFFMILKSKYYSMLPINQIKSKFL